MVINDLGGDKCLPVTRGMWTGIKDMESVDLGSRGVTLAGRATQIRYHGRWGRRSAGEKNSVL